MEHFCVPHTAMHAAMRSVHSAPSSKLERHLTFVCDEQKGGPSLGSSSGNGSAADSGFSTGGSAQITAKNDLQSLHGKIQMNTELM